MLACRSLAARNVDRRNRGYRRRHAGAAVRSHELSVANHGAARAYAAHMRKRLFAERKVAKNRLNRRNGRRNIAAFPKKPPRRDQPVQDCRKNPPMPVLLHNGGGK